MDARASIRLLKQRLAASIIGQEQMIERLLLGLLTNSNLRVEGLPGLTKTRAIQSLARHLEEKLSKCAAHGAGQERRGMQKHIVVAVVASMAWALVGGTAMGQVAGSTIVGVTVEEQKALALGWSAKKHILGKAVYNW